MCICRMNESVIIGPDKTVICVADSVKRVTTGGERISSQKRRERREGGRGGKEGETTYFCFQVQLERKKSESAGHQIVEINL